MNLRNATDLDMRIESVIDGQGSPGHPAEIFVSPKGRLSVRVFKNKGNKYDYDETSLNIAHLVGFRASTQIRIALEDYIKDGNDVDLNSLEGYASNDNGSVQAQVNNEHLQHFQRLIDRQKKLADPKLLKALEIVEAQEKAERESKAKEVLVKNAKSDTGTITADKLIG